MKVVIIYRPDSEHARTVEQYVEDFHRFHPDGEIELTSIDTQEGSQQAELYGIVSYPAVLALKSDGQMDRSWTDGQLPLMNDLAYYLKR